MRRIVSATFNSFRGFVWAFRHEAALRQEVIALILALPLAWIIADDAPMFIALIGVVFLLIAVELLNTAIEKLADHVTPDRHPEIGLVKDLGSAAVFAMLWLCGLVWGYGIWRWWSG
jgi:diacylglycerol kinase (ATP)